MKKIIFIIIIVFLFSLKGVKALESNLEFINNVYYNISINDNLGEYFNYDNQAYIRINNNIVYCLEPDKVVYNNLNYNEGTSNLSSEQLKQILLIGHYGYDYFNHGGYRYYTAAQELIWKIVRPKIELLWTVNNVILDLSSEKNNILYLVNNHLTKPSFDNKTFNMKENEELILKDDILLLYDVMYNGGSDVRIEGNKLIIKKRGANNEEILLKKRIKYDNLKTKYYVSNNYQTLVLPRIEDEIISKINLEVNYGSVEISRVDSESGQKFTYQEASLNGSVYQLYDSNMMLINEFIYTDNYKINELPFGTYYLKEKEASQGYLKDNNTYTIKIDRDNRNINLVLKIDPIRAKLIINNLYGDLREKGNSIFMIYDMEVCVNDGSGEIVLKYGKYPVKQVSTMGNHILVSEFEVEIKDTNTLEYTIINEEIKGNINIYSTLDSKNIIEEDFTYKIFNIDKGRYLKVNDSELIKAEKGIINLNNISLGNYYLELVSSMPQYEPVKSKVQFIVSDTSDIEFEFRPAYGLLYIANMDELGETVYTSSINLYCKNDMYFNSKKICLKDELIVSSNLVDGSLLIPDLIKGEYYVIQTSVDDKYILNQEKIYIDISTENTITINSKFKPIEEKNNVIDDNEQEKDEEIIVEDDANKEIIIEEAERPDEEKEEIIDIDDKENKITNNDENILEPIKEYIKIPNTGVKVFKINWLFSLIIIFMGYIVVRYAKE